MKMLPQVLFWLGLISVPFAWLVWYFGPEIEIIKPVLANISDPALRAALQAAHAERLGILVAVWPVSFLNRKHLRRCWKHFRSWHAEAWSAPEVCFTKVLRRLCSVVSNRRVRPCHRAAEQPWLAGIKCNSTN